MENTLGITRECLMHTDNSGIEVLMADCVRVRRLTSSISATSEQLNLLSLDAHQSLERFQKKNPSNFL